jgi:uncharacterized protein YqgC (DUF456 family)
MSLAGVAGCVLPFLPGPLLSFLALIILNLARDWQPFSVTFLLVMAGIAAILTILDYVVSAAGAKKYGASKAGLWGSIVGMIIGMIFFPPLGIFAGALVGAVIGEIAIGKKTGEAFRVGWGVFVGNLIGAAFKLAYCLMLLFFFITRMF